MANAKMVRIDTAGDAVPASSKPSKKTKTRRRRITKHRKLRARNSLITWSNGVATAKQRAASKSCESHDELGESVIQSNINLYRSAGTRSAGRNKRETTLRFICKNPTCGRVFFRKQIRKRVYNYCSRKCYFAAPRRINLNRLKILAAAGQSAAQMAATLKVSRNTVYNALERYGLYDRWRKLRAAQYRSLTTAGDHHGKRAA